MNSRSFFGYSKKAQLMLACFCFLVLITEGCAFYRPSTTETEPSTPRQALRIGAIPVESVEKTQDQLQPFISYLEKKTGFKVQLIVSNDYQSVIDKMRLKEIDIAMFGPFSYVLAHKQAGAQAYSSRIPQPELKIPASCGGTAWPLPTGHQLQDTWFLRRCCYKMELIQIGI